MLSHKENSLYMIILGTEQLDLISGWFYLSPFLICTSHFIYSMDLALARAQNCQNVQIRVSRSFHLLTLL